MRAKVLPRTARLKLVLLLPTHRVRSKHGLCAANKSEPAEAATEWPLGSGFSRLDVVHEGVGAAAALRRTCAYTPSAQTLLGRRGRPKAPACGQPCQAQGA